MMGVARSSVIPGSHCDAYTVMLSVASARKNNIKLKLKKLKTQPPASVSQTISGPLINYIFSSPEKQKFTLPKIRLNTQGVIQDRLYLVNKIRSPLTSRDLFDVLNSQYLMILRQIYHLECERHYYLFIIIISLTWKRTVLSTLLPAQRLPELSSHHMCIAPPGFRCFAAETKLKITD